MARVLIVYATRTGETERIGQLVAEGVRFGGGMQMAQDYGREIAKKLGL